MNVDEAWMLFKRYYDGRWDMDLSQPPESEAIIKTMYNMFVAPQTHPDNGGTSGKFIAGQEARKALLSNASRQTAPPTANRQVCHTCDGKGSVLVTSGRLGRGGLRRRCYACGGDGLHRPAF